MEHQEKKIRQVQTLPVMVVIILLLNASCDRERSSASALFQKSPSYAIAAIAANCNTDDGGAMFDEIQTAIFKEVGNWEGQLIEEMKSPSGERYRLIISLIKNSRRDRPPTVVIKLFNTNEPEKQRVQYIIGYNGYGGDGLIYMFEDPDLSRTVGDADSCVDVIKNLTTLATNPDEWILLNVH